MLKIKCPSCGLKNDIGESIHGIKGRDCKKCGLQIVKRDGNHVIVADTITID